MSLEQWAIHGMFHFMRVLLQRPVTWTPMDLNEPFGKIAFPPTGTQTLILPDTVPADAKEILLFAAVDTSNSTPGKRDFVRVFTDVKRKQCAKYIALHTCPEKSKIFQSMRTSWMTNSNNMWLPVGTEECRRKVYVDVLGGLQRGQIWGEVHLIGYR